MTMEIAVIICVVLVVTTFIFFKLFFQNKTPLNSDEYTKAINKTRDDVDALIKGFTAEMKASSSAADILLLIKKDEQDLMESIKRLHTRIDQHEQKYHSV